MARVTITEWENTNREQSLPDGSRNSVDQTAITSFATSTLSAAFGEDTVAVTLSTDTALHCKFDGTATPTATTNSQLIHANTSESWAVKPGDKLAIIAAA